MKRIVILFMSAVLLLSFAACGQEEFLSSDELSSAIQAKGTQESVSESTPENGAEKMAAVGGEIASEEEESQPEMVSISLPPMVRVRWRAGDYSAMLQLPESGLEAFWEHADDLLTEIDRLEGSVPEDGGFDYLVSSPYYSGQEALLDDLFRFSDELPQHFYWIDEDTVRAAWEIGTYLSVTCQDRVAHFDWNGKNDENLEYFDLFLTMSPEAELPDYEGNARYRYTSDGEWEAIPEHPGFDLLQVTSEPIVPEKKLIDYLMG